MSISSKPVRVDFWAKTLPDGQPGISVRDHCLNVGCVAEALLKVLPEPVRALLPPGVTTLVALHDVGKLSPGFLSKCPTWRQRHATLDRDIQWDHREKNHAAVSQAVIGEWLGKELAGYAIAAGGHHGFFFDDGHRPSLGQGGRWLSQELTDPLFVTAREDLRRMLAQVLGHDLPTMPLNKKNEPFIVFLTGFMTFADWLGSNETFFLLDPKTYADPLVLSDAAELSRNRSSKLADWLRWGQTEVRGPLTFDELFPLFPSGPKPIQRILMELAVEPGLFIVEAPMGGGKTEAALAAAYRRWTTPQCQRGLYFALPTQLTSERIFDRLETFLAKALARSDLATLIHGCSWLREDRVLEIHPTSPATDAPDGDDEPAAYARDARLWFASSRQALLAPFGAGTIDQALLAVLPAKHCGLRLFGLAGKVVVLDEVHSYDNYTGTLIDRLVKDLMRLKATVIILSATLTSQRKRKLLASTGLTENALPAMSAGDDYPMITSATRDAQGEMTASVTAVPWDDPPKAIRLDHRSQADEPIWEQACQAAREGACVLVIRNTVATAQETWRKLKGTLRQGDPSIALLHGRFPRWQRDALEDHWIGVLGKRGPRPRGCLLVATQVVEQSVDIDADLLITDLAPTDLIFQRLGRLHRHPRARPDGHKMPKAIILHPEISDDMDEKQLKAAFGPSGLVYPPYVLWRSSRQWRSRSGVAIPEDIRPWLEETYAPFDHTNEPAVLALFSEWDSTTEKLAVVAGSRANRLSVQGHRDTEGTFTRWNAQPSVDLLLTKSKPTQGDGRSGWDLTLLDGQTVTIPAFEWNFDSAKAIHRNVVKVPCYAVRTWRLTSPPWLATYLDSGVLGVVDFDQRILPLSEATMPYVLHWHQDMGVAIDKNEQLGRQGPPLDEPQDGWW